MTGFRNAMAGAKMKSPAALAQALFTFAGGFSAPVSF
jgi:hypothetical protein